MLAKVASPDVERQEAVERRVGRGRGIAWCEYLAKVFGDGGVEGGKGG